MDLPSEVSLPPPLVINFVPDAASPPAAGISAAIIAFLLPWSFPNHGDSAARSKPRFSVASLARLDVIGAFLLLASSILLVFGFEEGGTKFPWSSPVIIAPLAVGGALMLIFVVHEKFVDKPGSVVEPMVPLRLFRNKAFLGLFL